MNDPWIPDAHTATNQAVPSAAEVLYQDHDFDEVLPAGWSPENSQWPPTQFQARNRIFTRLRRLRGGDLGLKRGAFGPRLVYCNDFARYSSRAAFMLAMGRPTVGGAAIPIHLAVEWIDDQTVYGGCIVAQVDGELMSIDPEDWYPLEGGGSVTAVPWFTGDQNYADRIEFTEWSPDGNVWIDQYAYNGAGSVGRWMEGDEAEGMLAPAIAPPGRGHTRQWGSTKYYELFPIVAEIARRLSRNSNIFDLYSGPIPVFDQAMKDARSRFDIPDADTDDEAREKILEGYREMLAELSIHLPGDILKVSFLQPHVQGADYALNSIKELRDMGREIIGMPDLTGRTLSGEALKRLYLPWYAESDVMLESASEAITEATGLPASWPHPFDTGMFDAAVTGPPPADEEGIPTGAQR